MSAATATLLERYAHARRRRRAELRSSLRLSLSLARRLLLHCFLPPFPAPLLVLFVSLSRETSFPVDALSHSLPLTHVTASLPARNPDGLISLSLFASSFLSALERANVDYCARRDVRHRAMRSCVTEATLDEREKASVVLSVCNVLSLFRTARAHARRSASRESSSSVRERKSYCQFTG